MKSANFEIKNGKIVLREAALRYSTKKPAANEMSAEVEEKPPSAKPLTRLKTIVSKIKAGELKVDDQVIKKVAEGINKSHVLAKEPNIELLVHLVDELVNGTYKCDDKVLEGAADTLNKAQVLDKFADDEES